MTTLVGAPVRRREDVPLLTGRGRYTDDVVLPRTGHLVFVRSPHPHAEVLGVDTTAALTLPGVLGVWSAADLPDIASCRSVPGFERPVLATDRVRFVGEGVAVVVATSREAAVDGAELVAVDYRPLPAVLSVEQALAPGAPVVLDGGQGNVLMEQALSTTDGTAEVAAAPHRLSLRLENQRVSPLPMEPIATLASWEGGRLTVWATTQAPHRLRNDLCEQMGLAQDRVRVVAPDVGGGFGAKACSYPEYLICAELSRRLGRPVRSSETRSESMLAMTHGRGQVEELSVGFDEQGHLLALSLRVDQDLGAYPEPVGAGLPALTAFMSGGCYLIPTIGVVTRAIATNTTPISAYRGAGRPEAAYLIERTVDEVAAFLGLDPVLVRRRNLVPASQMPFTTQFPGIVYDESDYPRLLDTLLGHLDLDALRADQARRAAAGDTVRLGVGLSTWVELGGFGPSPSVEVFGYLGGWEGARVTMNADASVVVAVGTSPHGQGHETAFAQIAGDALGVGVEAVTVMHGDTAAVQEGIGTFGSRGMAVGGPAVLGAAQKVRERLVTIAAHRLEVAVDDVVLQDGRAWAAGEPATTVALVELARAAYSPASLPEGQEIGLEASHRFEPGNLCYPSGAHAAVVEVDTETGLVTLVRYVAVDDCGTMINPLLVRGQVEGGLAQGIAQALMEGVTYREDGRPVAEDLADYDTPSAPDLPTYETHHVEVPTSFNPLGAKGVGEAGATAAPQAVVNAALDALRPLGVSDLQMPLTPERVWTAIDRARSAGAPRPATGGTAAPAPPGPAPTSTRTPEEERA